MAPPALEVSNSPHPECDCTHHQPNQKSLNKQNVLSEITPNRQAIDSDNFSIESLTADLDSFHIHSPEKKKKKKADESRLTTPSAKSVEIGKNLASLFCDENLTGSPKATYRSPVEPQRKFYQASALDLASRKVRSEKEQVARVQAGQYDWVMTVLAPFASTARSKDSLPAGSGNRRHDGAAKNMRFGCNLLRHQSRSSDGSATDDSADVYTLVATRLDSQEPMPAMISSQVRERMSISTDDISEAGTTVFQVSGNDGGMSTRRASEVLLMGKHDDIVEQIIALPPLQKSSRIEDSVDALDRLEEEMEALDRDARMHIHEPQAGQVRPTGTEDGRNALVSVSPAVKRQAATRRPAAPSTTLTHRPSTRNSLATMAKQSESGLGSDVCGLDDRKIKRPTSLLPPKPVNKSSKPATVPSFELPGEAVARRLKEQREARRSIQTSSEHSTALPDVYSPSKPHFKSSKPPTRPTFELPGEAISRRKREEHEAKLKAQEEEERKRREFKARPIRSSINSSTFPRETIASRARQNKPELASKRMSIGRAPIGRVSDSPTRAVPSSTIGGSPGRPDMHRTVSREEAALQKERGKKIYSRDNGVGSERAQERRDREQAIRLARQQAAEQSRQTSREWADKQRDKAAAGRG